MRASFLAAVLLLLLSSYVFGQTSNATVGGTVSDATGALIPGVTIKATNTATGIVTMVFSNEAGAYQFASLQTADMNLHTERRVARFPDAKRTTASNSGYRSKCA